MEGNVQCEQSAKIRIHSTGLLHDHERTSKIYTIRMSIQMEGAGQKAVREGIRTYNAIRKTLEHLNT